MQVRSLEDYQALLHQLKYAKWVPSKSRRELTWDDTVDRVMDWLDSRVPDVDFSDIESAIKNKKIMPSMRLVASAGEAADRENLCIYNCMFMTLDSWEKLPKLMYALMCGTGVGFSVERRYIDKLPPPVKPHLAEYMVTFSDSRDGWATGYNEFLMACLAGYNVSYNVLAIRPAGAPLKVTGGYASGSKPLVDLLDYTKQVIRNIYIDGISPLRIYDLACKVADVVVQGGVRRSACIAFFSPDDEDMWGSKQSPSVDYMPHRHNANNTVMFETESEALQYTDRILESVKTSGDPGIAIRSVLKRKLAASGREVTDDIGMNPCGEIVLRDMQVCNLTEVVVRPEYSFEELEDLVSLATIVGLVQSKFYKFHKYMDETARLCQVEPLLGVSLTGLLDDPVLVRGGNCEALSYYRDVAHDTAAIWAPRLNVKVPAAITCVKPSGTVSKLVGCSPGIHPSFSEYYLSNISIPKDSPVDKVLKASGTPLRAELQNSNVYSFPMAAVSGSETNTTALRQLEAWRRVNKSWADHNVSCTIYVKEHEWDTVSSWLQKNIGIVSGLTFIPAFSELHHVTYMPLERITKEEYMLRVEGWPPIKWELLQDLEVAVSSGREYSCTSKEGCSL